MAASVQILDQSRAMERYESRESITLENQGQKIFGVLHRPMQHKHPFPAVLFCHGFASNKIGKYRFYVAMAEALTREGIAVFRFDYRGSGDSEGQFDEITLEGEVDDTLKALEFLQQGDFVDHKRIGILGRSLGGAVSILAAAREVKIQSLALWAPLFHAEEWKQKMKQPCSLSCADKQAMELMYGGFPNSLFLQQLFSMDLSPALNQMTKVPLLHIHGERDTVVPITQSKGYQQVRQSAVAPSQFVQLPQSDHSFSNREERMQALELTKKWFVNTLKGPEEQ